jgi:hypothetical protein
LPARREQSDGAERLLARPIELALRVEVVRRERLPGRGEALLPVALDRVQSEGVEVLGFENACSPMAVAR